MSAPHRPLSSLAALRIRVEMVGVGMRMLAAHPGFGVGLAQFRSASRGQLSAELATVYPLGENAHNNFVQIVAEFGVVGGCAIAAVLSVPLLMSWKALAQPDSPPELAGFAGGAAAFLVTCLSRPPVALAAVPVALPPGARYAGGPLVGCNSTTRGMGHTCNLGIRPVGRLFDPVASPLGRRKEAGRPKLQATSS